MPHKSKRVLVQCLRGNTAVASCTMEGCYPPQNPEQTTAHQNSLQIRFPRSYVPSQHASEAQRGAAVLGTECDVTRLGPSIPTDISSHFSYTALLLPTVFRFLRPTPPQPAISEMSEPYSTGIAHTDLHTCIKPQQAGLHQHHELNCLTASKLSSDVESRRGTSTRASRGKRREPVNGSAPALATAS